MVAALAITVGLGGLGGSAADSTAHEAHVYISAGSEYRYLALDAPLPAHRLGPIALAALESLRNPNAVVPSVLGELPAVGPAAADSATKRSVADWLATSPKAAVGRAPFGTKDKRGRCRCATDLGDTTARRIATLHAARTFTVDAEIASLRLLLLRARYSDGLVAYINGREVARRNLDPEAGPLDIARRPHGPEWETFYIPVVPGLLTRGENLLTVEVHPSGTRRAPDLDLELVSTERARIVRGPMIQRVSATAATIVFETDLPVYGAIEYGTAAAQSLTRQSAGGGLAMRHVVELTELPPSKAVSYRVIAGGQVTGTRVFHTAPAPEAVIRFAVYGDVRGGHDIHQDIVASVLNEAPDFVVVTGDLVLRGTDEADWQRFFTVTGELLARVPYYPAVGNHDMGRTGDQRRRVNEIFELWPGPENRPSWGHWYSFDVADVHFVVLDSNSYEHAMQLDWLEQDLRRARARGVRAIFAAMHDGPYSRGYHGGNAHAAQNYVPVLARHGVTLAFSGHDHLYQRGQINGLAYMVSGGGGAPLYSIRCGVPGRHRCRVADGMQHAAKEHHWVLVTVYRDTVEACPKRMDGTLLEECTTYRLRR